MKENNYKVAFFSLLFFILGGLVVGIIIYNMQDKKSDDKKQKENSNEIISNENKKSESEIKDSEVIKYLENKYEDISSAATKENAKGMFIEIVDFLFYDGEIKGQTLSSLTGKAKLEAISLCTKIEMKIEEKHPGLIDETENKYKEKKEYFVSKYNEAINKYCENNSESCESFKESYEDIKKAFNKTFDKAKEYGSKGIEKVSNWYSNYKNN